MAVFIGVSICNFAVFSKVSGCGAFAFVPEVLAWNAVAALRNQFLANSHPKLVLVISALISSCFLTGVLALVTWIARKKGRLQSERALSIAFAIAAVIYIFLSSLPVPAAPC
jgi:hypothetical protein